MSTQDTSQVPIGTVLEGKFRITQEIGRGGMAAVYEAENVDIGKRVAVKILSAELISSHVVRERFMREARAAAAIHSPYICEVYDSGMFHDRPFLVMELLEGESLYDRMTRVRRMKVSTTLTVMRHVVKGLTKAHEAGVVHRDLKPENIFLTRDAEGRLLAKVVDFGLAKFYEGRGGDEKNVRLTREGALFGTPAYMSPEQARGQGEVDHRADLWALGCIVYECLTGRTVWDVQQGVAMILAQIARGELPHPLDYRPDLPDSFVVWFRRALHPNIDERFDSGRSFLEALEVALNTSAEPSSEQDPSAISFDGPPSSESPAQIGSIPPGASAQRARLPEPMSSSKALLWLVLGSLTLLLAFGIWVFVLHPAESGESAASVAEPSSDPERTDRASRAPLEKGPGADLIQKAQVALGQDQFEAAISLLKSAKGENPNVAGSLIAHAEVALESKGSCQLAGIGRPRPFDVTVPASHVRIGLGSEGLLAVWTDAHQDAARRNVYSALLDESLRRTSQVRNITPEAVTAIFPDLVADGSGFATLYWDAGHKEPGVYVRSIEPDGRIRSKAELISKARKDQYFPTFIALPSSDFVAVWTEALPGEKRTDLVLRRLAKDLAPSQKLTRLTALSSGDAMEPAAFVENGALHVAYRYKAISGMTEIRLLRVPLDDPSLTTGALPGPNDSSVGETVVLKAIPRQAEPSLACNVDGCLVVWDHETGGAYAAFVRHKDKEALWHSDFASQGRRPTITKARDGSAAVAYYSGDRLFLAPISKEGVGRASVISRVSGFQPAPHVLAGDKMGTWWIAWRDFEAGHLEVFVARAECSPESH